MTDSGRPVHDPTTDTTSTEVVAAPIATTPLGGSAGTPATAAPRRSRARWLAALAIVALIVGLTAIATLSLTGSSPASTVVGYVPVDSVAYGEVRLDLPGDQRQNVGAFLSKFPGFADQASLDTKLDEVLDRLLSESTEGKQTYTRDIKPWFDGQLAFSMGPLPTDPATAASKGRALLLLSIKDETLARAWVTKTLTDTGVTGTAETYEGVELTTFVGPEKPDMPAAIAFIGGKVALVGDVASVKSAIDTGGTSPLGMSPDFAAAGAALTGDDIGSVFVDLRSMLDAALKMTDSAASGPPVSDAMLALIPDWAAFRLRVEGDALMLDGAMPHIDAAPGPDDNQANGVAAFAPASTIALAAGNDYGATVVESLALLRQDPRLKLQIEGIEEAAAILGGLDSILGWMGDSGVVIARSGDSIEGGIVSIPADPAAGRQLLTTLRSFATLAGSQYGISVRDEDHAGTTITIIDLGTAENLAGLASGLGGVPVPSDATANLPDGQIEISYAATDGVVIIGGSPDFVRNALDAGAGQSLADDARFGGLVGRVGTTHTGLSFVDIVAVRALIESKLPEASPEKRAQYEESIKPFLTPFDAFIAATVTGDLEQQHALITVK